METWAIQNKDSVCSVIEIERTNGKTNIFTVGLSQRGMLNLSLKVVPVQFADALD
jgi:hypothetical protein